MSNPWAVIGLVAAMSVAAQAAHSAPQILPDNVLPVHYDLSLTPDAQAMTYRGVVDITLDVTRATTDILLNAEDLAFDSVTIDGEKSTGTSSDEKLGRASLHFGAPIRPGTHKLRISYHAKLRRETLGFFAMDYAGERGPRRTLGTNFEPSYARRLLPCWDEPARKATFTITVDAPKDQMAISNMPVATVIPLAGNLERVRFATTPKMSTYLLFLAIGDFERVHRTIDGVDVGIVVKRGDTAKAAYALDEATKLLHYYDDYFGVRFVLPKLDLIAAPGSIEGDSMENWGAIFYSQSSLLFDPAMSTELDRRRVFLVVSHEMSHQWFGDLVTMAWWDNLWLNEGFARWMQTYAADALHPEWKTGLGAQAIFERGKEADALPSTHAVVQTVDTVEQAQEAFDGITYNKGAAVITMLNAYIGQDAFREGVRRYMRAHAFGNTVDTDLWSIMQTVAKKPVLEIEHDFTRIEGLPLVRVSETPNGFHLEEDRFLADPSLKDSMPAHQLSVPLTVSSDTGGKDGRVILLKDAADVALRPPLLVNAGQTSYARVQYPQSAFDALLPSIGARASVDQLGLIDDGYALGLAGYGPLSNFAGVVSRLAPGSDPIVWRRVAAIFTELDRRYAGRQERTAFRAFARGVLTPALAQIGAKARDGEDANIPLARAALTQSLGLLGDPAVTAWSRKVIVSGEGSVEEKRSALVVAAAQADEQTFELLRERARKTIDPLVKEHILESLGGVQDEALARRAIMVGLSSEVPAGDNADMFYSVAQNHPDLFWREGVPHIGDPGAALSKTQQWLLAEFTAQESTDPARIADVADYVNKNVPVEARRPFAAAPLSIRRNERIATQVLPELDRWIAEHAPGH